MLAISRAISEFIREHSLPDEWREIFADLYDPVSKLFSVQEGICWDYKREFPFSNSDDYFAGIVRLVCAFYNTYGGIIIFGVHDEARTAGHNKVKINIERINNVLRQKLSAPIELVHRSYQLEDDDEGTAIDVVLVPKRPMSVPPVRPIEPIGRYEPGTIWMRSGHEVVEPHSTQLPFLYGSREQFELEEDANAFTVPSSMPPNPATLKEFIGRRDALDRLYTWVLTDEEPRMFLYGKGGSGKSTIAYEFARMLTESGGKTNTAVGRPFDFIVYLSAKKKALDPISGKIVELSSSDFHGASEKFRAILLLSEWMDPGAIEKLSDRQVLKELSLLFDTAQILLVVDDIDTLTTAGADPGMDDLYRLLSRAKAGGKVLYTLRNAPSQSLSNSIEVPGLRAIDEYPAFIETCSRQFKVPAPSPSIVEAIATHSERRPLAVEIIIGLRRTAGSYEEALRLFLGKDGEGARRYLFQREYDALAPDNRSRLLLAALALFRRPVRYSELQTVLQFSPEQIKDGISETLEMFLQVDDVSADESLYSLGQATAVFVSDVSAKLTYYEKLKANVKYVKSPFLAQNSEIAQIKFRVRNFIAADDIPGAYDVLRNSELAPIITQHPEYNLILGSVASKLKPIRLDEARTAFRLAVQNGASDQQSMREWYWMEKDAGFNGNALEVCDQVIGGKRFSAAAKSEFFAKKAHVLFERARSSFFGDPEASFEYLTQAIDCFLEAYAMRNAMKVEDNKKLEGWILDLFKYYMISVSRSLQAGRTDLAFKFFDLLDAQAKQKRHTFDLCQQAISDFCLIASKQLAENRPRYRTFLNRLVGSLDKTKGLCFADENIRTDLIVRARNAAAELRGT